MISMTRSKRLSDDGDDGGMPPMKPHHTQLPPPQPSIDDNTQSPTGRSTPKMKKKYSSVKKKKCPNGGVSSSGSKKTTREFSNNNIASVPGAFPATSDHKRNSHIKNETDKIGASIPSPVPSNSPPSKVHHHGNSIALISPSAISAPAVHKPQTPEPTEDIVVVEPTSPHTPDDHTLATAEATTLTPQVVAELAPKDEDVAARVAIQVEHQFTTEWNRIHQEFQTQWRNQRQSEPVVTAVKVGLEEPLPSNGKAAPGTSELKRRIIIFVFLCILVVAATVGTVVGVLVSAKSDGSPTSSPSSFEPTAVSTASPTSTPTESSDARRAYLMRTLGNRIAPHNTSEEWAVFDDPETPQAQAMAWMSQIDLVTSEPGWIKSQVLLERYALAVLYFATSGSRWLSNPSFLNTSTSVCEWNDGGYQGITTGALCSDFYHYGVVTYVALQGIRLEGSIPWEISLLDNLVSLYLNDNWLTGSLPSQLGDLSLLKYLWLNSNYLTGALPSNMPVSLEELLLTSNYISGTIASEWASAMPHLIYLMLGQNQLEGSIPSQWATSATTVQYWDVGDNDLTGTIPGTSLGRMTNLKYISMERNWITGSLPSEIGFLTDLEELYVFGNSDLTGTVPQEFANLHRLDKFWFEDTGLSGSVDSLFCMLDGEVSTSSSLSSVRGDCLGDDPEIRCTCCYLCCMPTGDNCNRMDY